MADAIARVTSGKKIGMFVMQHGPGAENAYGGVAQAYSESVPILVMPMGYAQRIAWVDRNFFSSVSMKNITKSAEPVTSAKELPNVMRRAFQRLRSGRGGPVLVEVPNDLWAAECDPKDYVCPQDHPHRHRSRGRARGRQDAGRGQAARDLCRHRACTGPRPGASSRSWPSCWPFP